MKPGFRSALAARNRGDARGCSLARRRPDITAADLGWRGRDCGTAARTLGYSVATEARSHAAKSDCSWLAGPGVARGGRVALDHSRHRQRHRRPLSAGPGVPPPADPPLVSEIRPRRRRSDDHRGRISPRRKSHPLPKTGQISLTPLADRSLDGIASWPQWGRSRVSQFEPDERAAAPRCFSSREHPNSGARQIAARS